MSCYFVDDDVEIPPPTNPPPPPLLHILPPLLPLPDSHDRIHCVVVVLVSMYNRAQF